MITKITLKGEYSGVGLVNNLMPNYDLGTIEIGNHEAKKLTEAIGIPDHRFEDVVNLARDAWDHEDTICESIEYLVQNSSGSELVLSLVFFGRIWEDNQKEEEED